MHSAVRVNYISLALFTVFFEENKIHTVHFSEQCDALFSEQCSMVQPQ
jgi:hypothetical protein